MSSYSSRYGGSSRDSGRSSYDRRGARDKSWNRNHSDRDRTAFRRREHHYYGRKDPYRNRRGRDEEIVLIRRDPERADKVEKTKEDALVPSPVTQQERKVDGHLGSSEKKDKIPSPYIDAKLENAVTVNFPNYGIPENTPNSIWRSMPETLHIPLPQPFSLEQNVSIKQEVSSVPQSDHSKFNLKQEKIIGACISNFKTQGDYDRIRRECMLDIDTKSAFINVMGKVTDITNRFLQTAQYHPNMDKAKMRESLKKSFELSRGYQTGLESLINQILIPKISSTLQPMVESEVNRSLGLDTSTRHIQYDNQDLQQGAPATISCLFPVDVITESKLTGVSSCTVNPDTQSSSKLCASDSSKLTCDEIDLQLHEEIMEELNTNKPDKRSILRQSFLCADQKDTVLNFQNYNHFPANNNSTNDLVRKNELDPISHVSSVVDTNVETTYRTANVNYNPKIKKVKLNESANERKWQQTLLHDQNVQDNANDKSKELKSDDQSARVTITDNDHSTQHNSSDQTKHLNPSNPTDLPSSNELNCLEQHKGFEDVVEESESEEESPEFEKIGEISPVRVDSIPSYDFAHCNSLAQGNIEEVKVFAAGSLCSGSDIHSEIAENNHQICSIEKADQQPLCQFLDPVELLHFDEKKNYFKRVSMLSPSNGKTRYLINKQDPAINS